MVYPYVNTLLQQGYFLENPLICNGRTLFNMWNLCFKKVTLLGRAFTPEITSRTELSVCTGAKVLAGGICTTAIVLFMKIAQSLSYQVAQCSRIICETKKYSRISVGTVFWTTFVSIYNLFLLIKYLLNYCLLLFIFIVIKNILLIFKR